MVAVLREEEGCAALKRVFERRGFRIASNARLDLEGLSFTADGWDAAARVGFEYLTHEAGDHLDLTPEERAALVAMMRRGELFVLLIDAHSEDTAADLEWAAERFLDEVGRRRGAGEGSSP